MTSTPDSRIEKLPRWAQQHISRLEQDLQTYQERASVAEGHGPQAASRVVVDPYSSTPLRLREESMVRFEFGEHVYLDVSLVPDGHQGPWVRLHTSDYLHIQPQSSNSAHVRPAGRQ